MFLDQSLVYGSTLREQNIYRYVPTTQRCFIAEFCSVMAMDAIFRDVNEFLTVWLLIIEFGLVWLRLSSAFLWEWYRWLEMEGWQSEIFVAVVYLSGTLGEATRTLVWRKFLNNAKFGQLLLSKIVATRCQIVRQECTKFDFIPRRGS